LAEGLRLMIGFDSQPPRRMYSPEALLQFRQKVLLHLETSLGDLSARSESF
jgi:hypothetical protein